jgi:ketosteroid isomerase-like protein
MKVAIRKMLVAMSIGAFSIPASAQKADAPRDNIKKWQEAFNRNDVSAILSLYAEDGLDVLPQGQFRGLVEIRKHLEARLSSRQHDVAINDKEDHILGDSAWSAGDWSEHVPGPDGKDIAISGLWTVLWVHQGELWKIQVMTAFPRCFTWEAANFRACINPEVVGYKSLIELNGSNPPQNAR